MTWDKNETAQVCRLEDAPVCGNAPNAKTILDKQECLLTEAEATANAILRFLNLVDRNEATKEDVRDFVSALAATTNRALRVNEMLHEIAAVLGVC